MPSPLKSVLDIQIRVGGNRVAHRLLTSGPSPALAVGIGGLLGYASLFENAEMLEVRIDPAGHTLRRCSPPKNEGRDCPTNADILRDDG